MNLVEGERYLPKFIGDNNNDCSSYVNQSAIFLRGEVTSSFNDQSFFEYLKKLNSPIEFCIIDKKLGDTIICIGVDTTCDNEELSMEIINYTFSHGHNLFLHKSKVNSDEILSGLKIPPSRKPPFEKVFNSMVERFWELESDEHFVETSEVEKMLELFEKPIVTTKYTYYQDFRNKQRNANLGIPSVSPEFIEEIAAHPSLFDE